MAGTVKIWWHDGGVRDVRYNHIPVLAEPEKGFETVAVSATPASSGQAPSGVAVAIIESDVAVRYRVLPNGIGADAGASDCKPIAATGLTVEPIGVQTGDRISFIEA